jgi:rhodanese-related sulfurtransferase
MGTLKKTFIFCTAFMALISVYAQDCAGQHVVKIKESHVIKTLEPRLAFEFIKKNRRNAGFVVLDIRTPQEFQDGHIGGAVNIDYRSATFGADLDRLDKTKTYFVYCRIGRRSAEAIGIMIQKGFTSIYRTPGDIVAWRAAGLPLVKGAKNT